MRSTEAVVQDEITTMERELFHNRRQAASSCGFVVTAASECPAGCTAEAIPGLFGAISGSLTCKDPRSVTASATPSPGPISSASGSPFTTVTQTNRVTVTRTTTASIGRASPAQSSSTRDLLGASNFATTTPAQTATSSAASPITSSSVSPTSTPVQAAGSGSKAFAQTTGGILTITFLTLGVLGAIILGIVLRRRRHQRQRQQMAKEHGEGEPMAELSSTTSPPQGQFDTTLPPSEEAKSSKTEPETAAVQKHDGAPILPPSSSEGRTKFIAGSAAPPTTFADRFRFSTVTSDPPDPNSRRTSSIYPEDHAEYDTSGPNPFIEQGPLPATRPLPVILSHDARMALRKREWEAAGGDGIPVIPANSARRPRPEGETWPQQLARLTGQAQRRTDRWDPDMPRGAPPIPERSARRPKPGDGPISREPLG